MTIRLSSLRRTLVVTCVILTAIMYSLMTGCTPLPTQNGHIDWTQDSPDRMQHHKNDGYAGATKGVQCSPRNFVSPCI
jgi:hypothetical protein